MREAAQNGANSGLTLSVLMAVYHGTDPVCFRQALASIANQSRPADEIVIVFDGAVDPQINHIIEHAASGNLQNRIKTIRHGQNMGLGHALNKGVEACMGDIIMRMDDDDISTPGRFEAQMKVIESAPDIDVLGGQIIEFGTNRTPWMRCVPLSHEAISKKIGLRNTMNHVTVCIRRGALLEAGNYDATISAGFEDYELWHRMLAHGCKFANIARPLVLVRFDRGQVARRSGLGYLIEEYRIHRRFLAAGFTNRQVFLCAMAGRGLLRLLPGFILSAIYGRTLRHPLPPEYEPWLKEMTGQE